MRNVKAAKASSIYYRFLKLMALAFIAASLFFLLINHGGTVLLKSYFAKTNYMEKENQKRLESFRNYIEENQLSSTDSDELTEWVNSQGVVWMQLYRNYTLLYDSQFPYEKADPEYQVTGKFYEWEDQDGVHFQDGPAQVFITGRYTAQFFNYALIVEFLLSLLLFTAIIMAGIRSPMKYIKTLSAEIGILEGGNLDYRITVTGNDEITVLAKGLDNMRESIREQISEETRLIRLNQSMITSLSHDLRTPLTGLLIYTEILKSEIDADRKQMQKWVLKIDEKAHQIKAMADCILEYSLQKKASEPAAMERLSLRSAFYDALSETFTCLEQKGFRVLTELTWEDREVNADPKYISRILDNISSNIIKYASCDAPVRIASFYNPDCCGFLFENEKRKDTFEVESTGIGVGNICGMMEEMGGVCKVEERGEIYRIEVWFNV